MKSSFTTGEYNSSEVERSRTQSLFIKPDGLKVQNFQVSKIQIIGQAQYKKQTSCQVCQMVFGKLNNRQHHCRVCANAVCNDCSKKSINKNRACDVCIMYNVQNDFARQFRERLDKMRAALVSLYHSNQKLLQESKQEQKAIKDINEKLKQDENTDPAKLQQEIQKKQLQLQNLNSELKKSKEELAEVKRTIISKESEYSHLKDQLEKL